MQLGVMGLFMDKINVHLNVPVITIVLSLCNIGCIPDKSII